MYQSGDVRLRRRKQLLGGQVDERVEHPIPTRPKASSTDQRSP